MLGCDPEFFFKKGKSIIGAEKIIPKKGLASDYNSNSKIIIDGVQAELNPRASNCREILAREIQGCFITLANKLKKTKGIKTDFTQTITISKKALNELAPASRQFGCAPSKNIHNPKSKIAIKDASKYKYRSAGGHIHLGVHNRFDTIGLAVDKALKTPEKLVPILDIIVGNTCVLIDRDEGNIERRKVYGRAGEFRTPAHGLEYRTLSNFWLKDYRLMSFVMGLARFAVLIVANSTPKNNIEKKFISRIRMKDIENAINNNDFELASKNFKRIKGIIKAITPNESKNIQYHHFPLSNQNLNHFEFFIKKGINHWIEKDPIKHWTNTSSYYPSLGWEQFLANTVQDELQKETPIIQQLTHQFI